MRKYSRLELFVNNLPYALMVILGSALLSVALGMTPQGWAAAGGYAAYGVVGALWVIVFICPYCAYYGAMGCPCGYGRLAAKIRRKAPKEEFARKFKRHIPVIVPLWIVPPAVGGIALVRDFSWPVLALVAAFAVDAFLVLPLVSRKRSCSDCPQKDDCPWMGKRKCPPTPGGRESAV